MNRFTPVVLGGAGHLDEPMAFDVAPSGKVYIIERKGGVKVYNPTTGLIEDVGALEVNHIYTNYEGETREAEEGLVGFILDPDFEDNNWVYMLYADPHTPKHNLSRFEIVDDSLILQSEQLLLDYHVQRNYCCHTGGGMDWDADGNLYVTIGNNTNNEDGSQTDQRQGMEYSDDQRGAANTNDLRGKIIRIHPEDDGTYTIPEGNLFPPGTNATRPEIYAMGLRNPWRISVDRETGWVYWSEVGPDQSEDTELGPRGYDEFNQAREPGFFGWPYFVGDNQAFPIYDYANDTIGAPIDPQAPINLSRNNTGLRALPPAQPALIYYEDAASEAFPIVGTGSRSASGNRVYHQADYPNAEAPFPAYYEGKYFITDLTREWIMVVSLDADGNYASMEEFLPSYSPVEPIDMDFGPDGQLYVLEYGSNWFRYSANAQLVRIEYNPGNRAPDVVALANTKGGQVPFEVSLSSEETVDYDGDALNYQWEITGDDGSVVQRYATANPTASFEEPGVYTAMLTATDPADLSGSSSAEIVAGNAPPQVTFDIVSSNQSFFFPGETVEYAVSVSDAEEGSLADGGISAEDVSISIDYVLQGIDVEALTRNQRSVDVGTRHFVAETMIESNNCFTCHQMTTASAGPAYAEVAERYSGDPAAHEYLANKIISGGSGVWGEIRMPSHPQLSQTDARLIADFILSLNEEEASDLLPARGSYALTVPEEANGRGSFVFRAAYRDQGVNGLPSIAGEDIAVLRSARMGVGASDVRENVAVENPRGRGLLIQPTTDSHIGYSNVDLTGIQQLAIDAEVDEGDGQPGGTIEVRLGAPDGELVGEADVTPPRKRMTGTLGRRVRRRSYRSPASEPDFKTSTSSSLMTKPERISRS